MIANLFYREVDDLLAVVIDSRRLDNLRIESERPGGFARSQLQSPLPLHAVLAVLPYGRLPGGRYGPLMPRLRHLDAGPRLRFHDPVTAARCLELFEVMVEIAAPVVLDGGWAVDCALGEVTREHSDLDVCVPEETVGQIVCALNDHGFQVMEDQLPTRLELRSRAGMGPGVDLHPLAFDHDRNGVQRQLDGSTFTYTAQGLAGEGRILGRRIACLTPEFQLTCHVGYEPDEDDYADVAALCTRFHLEPPGSYREALSLITREHDEPGFGPS